MNLSIAIIAKNESKHIESCLTKLKVFQAECIVVDTGSTDNTIQLAAAFGAKTFSFSWRNDFAAARNYAANLAVNDMILSIDCDEFLDEIDLDSVQTLMQKGQNHIGIIDIVNHVIHEDHQEDFIHEPASRLYNRKFYRFQGAVHETLVPIETSRSALYIKYPIHFQHMGYLTPEIRAIKSRRDEELLINMYHNNPKDSYVMYQLGKCAISLNQIPQAIKWFENAMDQNPNLHLEYVQNMIVSYGYALLDAKRFHDAMGLTAFIQELPDNGDYHFLLGLIYMNNALFNDAINSFKHALTCSSISNEGTGSYKAWYNIGIIQEITGQPEDAQISYHNCGDYPPALQRIASLK